MKYEVGIRLDRMEKSLTLLNAKVDELMATLDDVLKDVQDEKTAIGGLSDLISGLKQQLADVLSGTVLTPAVQAKVDAIFAEAEARKAELAAALSANTGPVPPTP